jgi:hypothetical protein
MKSYPVFSPSATRLACAIKITLGFCIASTGAVAADNAAPITPRETIVLFNGKDLTGFTTWETKHGLQDPDRVFTVVDQIDGAPAIRISGQHWGGIVTRERYADYRLVVEFRWGLVTWDPRKTRARDSGILMHCQGEEGNRNKDFRSPWMRSIEAQIIEGGTGDILVLDGYNRNSPELISPSLTATTAAGGKVWSPNGTPTVFRRGRIDWQFRDAEWKDVLGFRGRNDVEKPAGEWNELEVICDGGNVTCLVNGVKVNEATNGSFRDGRILVQSEGAEIFFRRIELHPLAK